MSYHISWVRGSDHCRLQVARPMTIADLCADAGIEVRILYEANPELTGDYVMDGETLYVPMTSWPEAWILGDESTAQEEAGEYEEATPEEDEPEEHESSSDEATASDTGVLWLEAVDAQRDGAECANDDGTDEPAAQPREEIDTDERSDTERVEERNNNGEADDSAGTADREHESGPAAETDDDGIQGATDTDEDVSPDVSSPTDEAETSSDVEQADVSDAQAADEASTPRSVLPAVASPEPKKQVETWRPFPRSLL